MGLDSIPLRVNGTQSDQDWWNVLYRVLSGDIVPRTAGVPTVGGTAGNLGSLAYPFGRLFIVTGGWSVGDIKLHNSYNGAFGPGHGWMLADGRQVTQVNYDAEHGPGSWAAYIGTSPMLNLYLDDYVGATSSPQVPVTGRYPVGTAATTQNGAAPITPTGRASNLLPLGSQNLGAGAIATPTLTGNQNIQPDSNAAMFYVRII